MKKLTLIFVVLSVLITGVAQSSYDRSFQDQMVVMQCINDPVTQSGIMAEKLLELSKIPGLSIAVSKKGKIVYAEGFGYADLTNKIRVSPETQFRTASVAKVITATALGKMIQDGQLDLNAGIGKYLPALPQEYQQITPLQLAGHLSGMPHYADDDKIENRFYQSTEEALKVFSHQKLISPPGTKYSYSTHGFTLLSAVMEKASGMNYLDYLNKELFKPLNMNNTGPDLRKHQRYTHLARLYDFKNDTLLEESNPEDVSYKWAGGGLISTPSDLLKLTFAYANGFLKSAVTGQMFRHQHLSSGEEQQIGIGWRFSKDVFGRNVIEHAGGMEGARTVVCMFPDQEVAVSIMVNASWPSSIEETAHLFAELFMDDQVPHAIPDFETKVMTSTLSKDKTLEGTGKLKFKGNIGNLTLSDGKHYAIIPLNRAGVYGLVSKEGIYYLEMKPTDNQGTNKRRAWKQVSGKAIAYSQQQKESAINKAPFLTFTSSSVR